MIYWLGVSFFVRVPYKIANTYATKCHFPQCRVDGPMSSRIRYDPVHRHGPRRDNVQRFRRRGVSLTQLHTGRPRPVAA